MTLLLQVSDPHFGTERSAAVDALVQLVHEQRPDVLLLSGDITQRATHTQFDSARAFVGRLQVPAILAIPGNHDIPLFNLAARLISPYARYMHAFGRDLEPEFENDEVLVMALNTTRRYRPMWTARCPAHRLSALYAGSNWHERRNGAWSSCIIRWP